MNSIFDVFEAWEDNYKVASHFELMEDFPNLTNFAQYKTLYSNITSFFESGALNYQQASVIALFFPPLKFESQVDYYRRLANTSPFNVYKSLIWSVIGLMGRKSFSVQNSENKDINKDHFTNINGSGKTLQNAINDIIFPSIMSGVGGILVDWINDKVVWSFYDARHISKKHLIKEYIDGEEYLKRVVIVTEEKEEKEGGFEYKTCKKALCLKLIDKKDIKDFELGNPVPLVESKNTDDFIAVFEIHEEEEGKKSKIEKWGAFKTKSGKYLNKIPFFIFSADDSWSVPFYSAAKKNFKHGDIESVFEEGLKISNFPMLQVNLDNDRLPTALDNSGDTPKQVFKISAKSVFELRLEEKISFVEWEGKSFQKTMDYMQILKNQIAEMVINTLADQKTQKTKAQYEGEQTTNTSLLLFMITSCETAINAANVATTTFNDLDNSKTPIIELNRDLVKEVTSPDFLRSILESWSLKFLSGDTAMKSLQNKELLPANTNFKLEQEKIQEEDVFAGTAEE